MPLHFVVEAAGDAQPGGTVALTGSEAHHAAAVRRVQPGERVTLGDGAGAWLDGAVESAAPREVTVRIDGRRDIPRPSPRLVLVQALAKGDRDELAVQAATELGADEIVPWQAARSVSRWDAARSAKGVARWSAIVREAAKQAHRAWIPTVSEPVSTAALAVRAAQSAAVVLEPGATDRLSELPLVEAADVLVVVGPEGGVAPDELAALTGAGARSARLGDTVLRTSTAGPAALAILSVSLGRW